MNKREFIKSGLGLGFGSVTYLKLGELISNENQWSFQSFTENEDFWKEVRKGYAINPEYINLENGYYCITPQETQDNFIQHVKEVNYQGSRYMRTVQWENKTRVTQRLANLIGARSEEVAITRNTTESLDTIIGGFPWKKGDEAVFAHQDYGAMKNMFDLQHLRHGVVNKIISIPNHPKSDEEIVSLYESAITDRTKLLMVCHMINITGHIMPVRKICDMAHSYGIDVMVDGAHAVAHIDFDINDLDCDYYGASLHKWLSTPLGAGLLYVKQSKIDQIWPLFAEGPTQPGDIKRLNHTGTHPVHTDLAINNAIDYYETLGSERKERRLRYIQRYWTDELRKVDRINVNTPQEIHRSCAIANVGIDGMSPSELSNILFEKYKIWTVAIDGNGVHGCRITPNIYTLKSELDQFIEAMTEIAKTS